MDRSSVRSEETEPNERLRIRPSWKQTFRVCCLFGAMWIACVVISSLIKRQTLPNLAAQFVSISIFGLLIVAHWRSVIRVCSDRLDLRKAREGGWYYLYEIQGDAWLDYKWYRGPYLCFNYRSPNRTDYRSEAPADIDRVTTRSARIDLLFTAAEDRIKLCDELNRAVADWRSQYPKSVAH
jgi:hypothetical protein